MLPEKRVVRVHAVADVPDTDCDLSHPIWRNVSWNSGFVLADQPEAPAPDLTEFAVVHDAENLYIAVKTTVTDLSGQPRYYTREDPKGAIQMMIDSEGVGRRTASFVLSGDGSAVGNLVDTEGQLDHWPGVIRCGFRDDGETWIVQFALRLADFRYTANSIQQWKFNLMRFPSWNTPHLWSTFAPLKEGTARKFYLPQNVPGVAEFEDPAGLAPYLWTVARTGRARVTDTAKGRVCRQEVRVTNLSTDARSIELRAGFDTDYEIVLPLSFEPNQTRVETLELPVAAEFEFGQFAVTLAEPGTGRHVSRNLMLVEAELLSWKRHFIRIEDSKGGCTCREARMQFLPRFEGRKVCPFGLAQMDNGEIILVGTGGHGHPDGREQTVAAFSSDGGATWSEYIEFEGEVFGGAVGSSIMFRPMMLTYLGGSSLSVIRGDTGGKRLFSHDYGRTWTEDAPFQPAPNGFPFGVEGNALVDRDENGLAIRIAETGYTASEGPLYFSPVTGWIRWSNDGGRTWVDASCPDAWRWQDTYGGKTYERGCCEGALVRAANGWIVAALRTDILPKWLEHPALGDNLEGTGVSISKDDGKTWSPIEIIFDAGRMHSNLLRLPNGDLVMTLIRRIDIRNGKLASYRKGCDAVISRDNGLTWEVEHLYVLDDFAYLEGDRWTESLACGHLYSTVLDDGSILTAFGNYLAGGELIKWKP